MTSVPCPEPYARHVDAELNFEMKCTGLDSLGVKVALGKEIMHEPPFRNEMIHRALDAFVDHVKKNYPVGDPDGS